MRIKLNSIFVEDQVQALKFYIEVLGFIKKTDIPIGEFRWLTVVSPEEQNGTELVLKPNNNPSAKIFQKEIFEQGIPATSFAVDNIYEEYERLRKSGIIFTMEPTEMGDTILTVFDDTCGNLIQIYQI